MLRYGASEFSPVAKKWIVGYKINPWSYYIKEYELENIDIIPFAEDLIANSSHYLAQRNYFKVIYNSSYNTHLQADVWMMLNTSKKIYEVYTAESMKSMKQDLIDYLIKKGYTSDM